MRISWHGYAALDADPAVYEWGKDWRWTLARVAALLMRLFSVPCTLRGTSYLLHRLGFIPAAHRAAKRTCTTSFNVSALWVEKWVPSSPSYLHNLRSNSPFQQDKYIDMGTVLAGSDIR
jgi:Winged helix-turn helix